MLKVKGCGRSAKEESMDKMAAWKPDQRLHPHLFSCGGEFGLLMIYLYKEINHFFIYGS